MFVVDDRWVMESTIRLLKQIPVYEHLGTTSYGVVPLCAPLSLAPHHWGILCLDHGAQSWSFILSAALLV